MFSATCRKKFPATGSPCPFSTAPSVGGQKFPSPTDKLFIICTLRTARNDQGFLFSRTHLAGRNVPEWQFLPPG